MKNKRQRRILEIVQQESIATQKELADRLCAEGFDITQATVSRDIKELKLIKVATGDDCYKYGQAQDALPGDGKLRLIFREFVLSYDYSENIVIVNTAPGNANTVAYVIDRLNWAPVIGTLAGDDTIMLIVKAKEDVPKVIELIECYLD